MRSDTLRARLDRRLALSACFLLPAAVVVGWIAQPLAGVTLLAGGLGGLFLARAALAQVAVRPLTDWLAGEADLSEAGEELGKIALRQKLASRRRRRAEAERDAARVARSRDRARIGAVAASLRARAGDHDPELAALACELDGEAPAPTSVETFALRPLLNAALAGPLAEADARGLPLGARVDPRLPTRLVGDPAALSRCLVACLAHVVAATTEGGVEVRASLLGSTESAVLVRVELDGYVGVHGWGDGEVTPGGLVGARALATSLGARLVVEEGGACVALSLPLGRADDEAPATPARQAQAVSRAVEREPALS